MRTNVYLPASTDAVETAKERAIRLAARGVIAAAAVSAIAVGMAGTAAAQTTVPQPVDGNVQVNSAIALTGLTSSFLLTGLPGATVAENGEVVFDVLTNNFAGYAVTVQAATATLVADTPGNTNSIPIGALSVRETGTTPFTAVSNVTPVTVGGQNTRSTEVGAGDHLSNDYQVVIPFVNEDNYDVTINYVATAL
jgi:hypothetical protein